MFTSSTPPGWPGPTAPGAEATAPTQDLPPHFDRAMDSLTLLEPGMPSCSRRDRLQLSGLVSLRGWPADLDICVTYEGAPAVRFRCVAALTRPGATDRRIALALQRLTTGHWQAAVPSANGTLAWRTCAPSNEPVLSAALIALERHLDHGFETILAQLIGDSRNRPAGSVDFQQLVTRLSAQIRDRYWQALILDERTGAAETDEHPHMDADGEPPRKRPRWDDDASAGGMGFSGPPVRS